MAFDGITVAAVVQELEHTLVGGRISKIAQPENDELLLTISEADGSPQSPNRHSSVSSTWILSIWMRWVTCAGKN